MNMERQRAREPQTLNLIGNAYLSRVRVSARVWKGLGLSCLRPEHSCQSEMHQSGSLKVTGGRK